MARRHPHINGNHERHHPKGEHAIHPHLRPGDQNDFGGHPGQARFGGGGDATGPSGGGAALPPSPEPGPAAMGPAEAGAPLPAAGPMIPD